MKTTIHHAKRRRTVCPAYPNAAGKEYYIRRLLDIAAAVVSGMGLLASIVFLAAIM